MHSVVHGTTLVTNTVIQRAGARVGLITTRGFRDSLEMGKETRYDLYDLFLEPPPTLVPRRCRVEVSERIAADGEVLLALDRAQVEQAARALVDEHGVEAIASVSCIRIATRPMSGKPVKFLQQLAAYSLHPVVRGGTGDPRVRTHQYGVCERLCPTDDAGLPVDAGAQLA